MHTNGNGQGMNTDRFFSSNPNGCDQSGCNRSGCDQSGGTNGSPYWNGSPNQSGSNRNGGSMSTSSARWNTEAASGPIDTTDLSIIQDEMHTEALLYKKCSVYANYFSDPALKSMAKTAAEHHRRHFDSLHSYLNSSK